MEPGSFGILKKNKISFSKYWWIDNASPNSKLNLNFRKSEEVLEDLLDDSLKKHLISDRKIGLFLSGGTDSNALLNFISQNFSKIELTHLHTVLKIKLILMSPQK